MQSNSTTEKFHIRNKGLSQDYRKVNKKSSKKRDREKRMNKPSGFDIANKIYDNFIKGNNEDSAYLKELLRKEESKIKKTQDIAKFQKRSAVIINLLVKEHRRLMDQSMRISTLMTDEELRLETLDKAESNNAQKDFEKNRYVPFQDTKKDIQTLVRDLIETRCLN